MPRHNRTRRPAQANRANCTKKVRYQTRPEAERVIADKMRLDIDTPPLSAYRCPICAGWHLTSRSVA